MGGASGRGRGRTAIVGGDCGLRGSQTAGGGHSAREFHTRPLGSGPEEEERILMNLQNIVHSMYCTYVHTYSTYELLVVCTYVFF